MSYGFEGGADFINMQQIERTLKMSIKGQRLDNKTRNCQGRIQDVSEGGGTRYFMNKKPN